MKHEYYKEYYELERQHWWFTARAEIIVGLVRDLQKRDQLPQGKLRILNVGCGPGRTSEVLTQFGEVISIEYDKHCCEFASELTGLKIIHGSITELPFEAESFDLVCAFDVIEHVEDDALAISELKRVARKDGVVFVTVPALMSLWSHHDVINFHFRRYTLPQLKKGFETNADGKVLFASYFNSFLFPPIYAFRKLANLFATGKKRKGSGSDFEAFNPGLINSILYRLMKSESAFLNRKIAFPIGVSILHIWKKS